MTGEKGEDEWLAMSTEIKTSSKRWERSERRGRGVPEAAREDQIT